jgi:hypothetical protein
MTISFYSFKHKSCRCARRAGVWGSGVISPHIFNSTVTPSNLCDSAVIPAVHSIRGWLDFTTRLDILEKRKISSPYRESNHESLVVRTEEVQKTQIFRDVAL